MLQFLLVPGMALVLGWRYLSLVQEGNALQAENDRLEQQISAADGDLMQEKKDFEGRVGAVRSFLAGRVAWTAYTQSPNSRVTWSADATTPSSSASR